MTDFPDLIENDGLFNYVMRLSGTAKSGVLINKKLYDFFEYLPDIYDDSGQFVCKEGIRAISELLDKFNLLSVPRMHLGYVSRRLDSTIIIFSKNDDVNYSSNYFKYGSLVVRVLVILAKSDGNVDSVEKEKISSLIQGFSFVNGTEINALKAKAICLIEEISLFKTDYYEYYINKIVDLGVKSQQVIIDLIKDVIVCDGYIDNSEIKFLRELYNALDIPTDNLRNDLTHYANTKKIKLRKFKREEIDRIYAENIDFDEMELDVESILLNLDQF